RARAKPPPVTTGMQGTPRNIPIRFLGLEPSIIIALPLAPGRYSFRPAVIRVGIAKSAIAGNHLGDALFESSHAAIVNKCPAPIPPCAPLPFLAYPLPNVAQ